MRRRRSKRRWVLGVAGATIGAAGLVVLHRATSLPHRLERLRAEIAIHERLGRSDDAAAARRRLLALQPDDLDALERLADHLAATGRPDEAERLVRDRLGAPPRPRVACLLAELMRAAGRDREAAALLEPLLRDLPALPDVALRVRAALLGGRVLAATGDLPRAQALLVECARLRDAFGLRNDTGDAMVVDLLGLADVLGRMGRRGEAEEALRRAHGLAPDGALVCALLAEALERRGARDEAIALLTERWRTCPSQRPAQAAPLLTRLVRAGRPDEALARAGEVAEAAPWAGPFARGLIAARSAPADAPAAMAEAVRLGAPAVEAHVVSARAALDVGDLVGARAALLAAVEQAPEHAPLELELLQVERRLGEVAAARQRAVRLLGVRDARDDALEALLSLEADEAGALADGGAPERARAGFAGGTQGDSADAGSSREAGERSRRTHHTDARRRVADLLAAAPDDPWLRTTAAALLTLSGDVDEGARALADLAGAAEVDLGRALGLVARGAEARGGTERAMALLDDLARRDPRLVSARLVLARLQLALGRPDLAREELEVALAVAPDLAEGWALLADASEATRDLAGAAAALERALDAAPGDVGLTRTLGRLHQRLGQPAAAVAPLAALADARPFDAAARAALARARVLAGQRALAAIDYEAALRLDPACVEAYGLAALHALHGAPADARRVLEAGGPAAHLRAALAAARGLAGDPAGALEALEALRAPAASAGDAARTAVTAAVLRLAAGRRDEAEAALADAAGVPAPARAATLAATPAVRREFLLTLLLRASGWQAELAGRARALVAGEPADPLLVWWTLDALGSDADPALRLALAERLRAANASDLPAALLHVDALEAAGQADRAREALSALAGQHDDATVWERLAGAHQATGDLAAATLAYERALALEPERVVSLNNLAVALGHDAATRPRAIALARRALELAPGVAAVRDTLGWLLVLDGDAEGARSLLREAVALEPLDPAARYHLARACQAAGDLAQARRLARLALLSGAPFAERAAAEALVAELQGGGEGGR